MKAYTENRAKLMKIGSIAGVVVLLAVLGWYFLVPKVSASSGAGGGTQGNVAVINGDVQEVTIDLKASGYAPIIVQKGIPVRFNIRAAQEDINGCNGTVVIPAYNVQVTLKSGDNMLEFTPDKTGNIPYSCWMGMVTSSINVVDDLKTVDPAALAATAPATGGLRTSCCSRQ